MHGLIRNCTSLVNGKSKFSLMNNDLYLVLFLTKAIIWFLKAWKIASCISHFQVYDVVCTLQCNFVKSFNIFVFLWRKQVIKDWGWVNEDDWALKIISILLSETAALVSNQQREMLFHHLSLSIGNIAVILSLYLGTIEKWHVRHTQ